MLALTLAAGAQANDIMLPLDPDAPFVCRGIRIALGTAESVCDVKLKTPSGDYLETAFVPSSRWAFGGGAPVLGNLVVALEAEVWCAAGGVWTLYLYNPAGAPVRRRRSRSLASKSASANGGPHEPVRGRERSQKELRRILHAKWEAEQPHCGDCKVMLTLKLLSIRMTKGGAARRFTSARSAKIWR